MKFLIDIGHPAHVHIFKNLAIVMSKKNHEFLFTVREGENEIELLTNSGFNFVRIGCKKKGLITKIVGFLLFTLRILVVSFRFKPDIFLSHGSMYAGFASFILRKPHVSLEDSGNMEQIRLYYPFCNAILTPSTLPNNLGYKQIRYFGNHELVYLHPDHFRPDPEVKKLLGINNDEPYAIIRLVSWSASHDRSQRGLQYKEKIELIQTLSEKMKIFISAEKDLEPELTGYRIKIPFEKMHDALYYATIYIGEGATMASEAGVLGTPSIYISSIARCYIQDQEKYGLVYNFRNFDGVMEKIRDILSYDNLKTVWEARKTKMITEKIDVLLFLTWFLESYPESFHIMKQNPDFQLYFKKHKND